MTVEYLRSLYSIVNYFSIIAVIIGSKAKITRTQKCSLIDTVSKTSIKQDAAIVKKLERGS